MPMPRATREPCQVGPLAVVALAATLLLVATGWDGRAAEATRAEPGRWVGLVAAHDAPAAIGQRLLVVLKAPSLADRVARSGGRASDVEERRWTREALDDQRSLLSRLALQGVRIRPEFRYARVLNGFSAAVDPRAVSLLERAPEVAGVYNVRATYPAADSLGTALVRRSAYRLRSPLPGFTGRGVTIALLDTGVDRFHPYLRGRVRRGFDIVDGDSSAAAEPHPEDPSQFERHGTEMAGVLVGAGRDVGRVGLAPGASLVPIRVAGWQRDATGAWAVYGRSDQLIAGLERAVDPNGDGDAHDAARIALVGVVEPLAAFPATPAARAVEGAMRLDTLVVVPAGNDGAAGPAYGRIAGPGGAPAALTVGAGDLRRHTDEVRVVFRSGLDVELDTVLPVAGAVAPKRPLVLPVAVPRARRAAAGRATRTIAAPELRDFFDRDGFSLVAGRAALVPAGSSPGPAVESAARAGAYAVLLYGESMPAGALGLDESVSVPVLALPTAAARELARSIAAGRATVAAIGPARSVRNAGGAVASFSSRGLAFDGRVKPELAAPGVAVRTAEPGTDEYGAARAATVNGTSVAAATVAGSAAVLAQARPALEASALKGVLVGSARPLSSDSLLGQGAGLVDVGAAAAAEITAEPASLAFETVSEETVLTRPLVVRNVSTRPVRVTASVEQTRRPDEDAVVSVSPRFAMIETGGVVRLTVTARLRGGTTARRHVEGAVRVATAAGIPIRVPWALAFARQPVDLLAGIQLRPTRFRPSDTTPAVLSLQAGRLLRSPEGEEVQPVSRLDVRLATAKGREIGLLARLRDLLPGWYAFGLTGRGPAGEVLRKGSYRLEIVAVPTGRGRPSRRIVEFEIRGRRPPRRS